MIKQDAGILAGCIVFREPAPDVCIEIFLNFGHWFPKSPRYLSEACYGQARYELGSVILLGLRVDRGQKYRFRLGKI